MSKWYEMSDIFWFRGLVRAELKLPELKNETATAFWKRVEEAGLLLDALELYDQCADEIAEWRGMRRERKHEFEARVEREGRREEAERLRTELVATGLSQREIQEKLVARLQPLDGTRTRAWSTPDPWEAGRLFRTKADQEELRALASDDDEDDVEAEAAQRRIDCAKWRREERQALRAARRRAHELKAKQARELKVEQAPEQHSLAGVS